MLCVCEFKYINLQITNNYNNYILDEVFVISGIIKVEISVINLTLKAEADKTNRDKPCSYVLGSHALQARLFAYLK